MNVARSVAEVLSEHVTLEVECIDRLYLNLYVPILQEPAGIGHFWIRHRGHRFATSSLMAPMTRAFVTSIERFAEREGIPLITFKKGQRKEDIAKEYLATFSRDEGVLFIGKAQEKASVTRTEKRRNPTTGGTYPWLVKTTSIVNQYYFYCLDRDFGPFFLKLCSYFPYNGKLCINGHEYVKRQLDKLGIDYETLDNGILSCEDPKRLQLVCDDLSFDKIEKLARKWLRRLPHPFTRQDQLAGYVHQISIMQAEFSLTQVLDRPIQGRVFFEQIIRDNIDIGRPDQVQLIFDRRITRRTPGRFRTRVITDGVIPSLHVDYRHSRIKQYHKLGRALRTELVVNDTYDFNIGRLLKNLPALQKVGREANRRLLHVQRISHDCTLGEAELQQLLRPVTVDQQRAAALRVGDPRALAILSALLLFRLLPRGFANRDLREHVGMLLAMDPSAMTQGRMTYDLRRLRLHGLVERIPKSHRYRVTDFGFRAALLLTRSYLRLLRPGFAVLTPADPPMPSRLRNAVLHVDHAIDSAWRCVA
jgi:DNA-binding transcriptional ArsR family regulator